MTNNASSGTKTFSFLCYVALVLVKTSETPAHYFAVKKTCSGVQSLQILVSEHL
jgi:hypothetical protein